MNCVVCARLNFHVSIGLSATTGTHLTGFFQISLIPGTPTRRRSVLVTSKNYPATVDGLGAGVLPTGIVREPDRVDAGSDLRRSSQRQRRKMTVPDQGIEMVFDPPRHQ